VGGSGGRPRWAAPAPSPGHTKRTGGPVEGPPVWCWVGYSRMSRRRGCWRTKANRSTSSSIP
jgi:hypothetical protein